MSKIGDAMMRYSSHLNKNKSRQKSVQLPRLIQFAHHKNRWHRFYRMYECLCGTLFDTCVHVSFFNVNAKSIVPQLMKEKKQHMESHCSYCVR